VAPQTMFERYGGFAKVSQIVSSFYEKMVDSPSTAPYFVGTDMRTLIDHQTKFIAYLMGGPASYTNDHLARVHEHLGITEGAYAEAVNMLSDTMEDFGVTTDDVRAMRRQLQGVKHLIVTRA
jgi:hemoglobin